MRKARKPMKLTRYDSADYLKSDADVAMYLEEAAREGGDDPAFIAHALGVAARARNMVQLAKETGLSREGLYKALSEGGNPRLDTVMKVARAMGVRLSFERV